MKKTAILMICAATIGLGACTAQKTELAPGKYKTTTTSKSSNGTNYSTEKVTDVDVNSNGQKVITTETKNTKDPEGLFNKSTVKTKTKTVD